MSFSLLLPLPLPNQPNHSSHQNSNLNANPSLFPIPHSLPFFSLTHTHRSPTRSNSVHEGRVHWTQNSFKNHRIVPETLVVLTFSTLLLCLRLFSNALLPDFPRRWLNLIAISAEAELRASSYPWHLWHAEWLTPSALPVLCCLFRLVEVVAPLPNRWGCILVGLFVTRTMCLMVLSIKLVLFVCLFDLWMLYI